MMKKIFKKHEFVLALILFVIGFIFSLINPNFIKPYNLLSMSQSLVPYGILTLGILFVIATGNTDLSLGSICITSAVIAGKLYSLGMNLVLVIPVMIIIGLICGVINGYLIAYKKIPSFIATLGTMMFFRGASAILVYSPNIFYPSGTWYNNLFSNYNGFPIGIVWLILFTVIACIVMYKTKIGRYLLSIGSNTEATRLSGINIKFYLFISYVISGLAGGIAGIFWSSSFATVATATGNGMEFDAIAAAFIGGSSASGGHVEVVGSVIGMMLLTIIRSGLNFILSRFSIDVNSTYVTYAVTGMIIIASILVDINNKNDKKRTKKNRNKIVVIVLAILLSLGIGGYVLSNKNNTKTIAVIAKDEKTSFWRMVKSGCEKAGEDYGYNITFRGPEGESPTFLPQSLSLAKTQLSDGPVAMGMATICEGFTDILVEAYNKNIPVVQYDSGVFQKDIETVENLSKNPIKSFVTSDNYGASALAARKTFEAVYDDIINCEDTYLVAAIQFNESFTAQARSKGFIEEFERLVNEDINTKGKCDFCIEVKPDELNNNYKLALESLSEKGADVIFLGCELVTNQVYDAITASQGQYENIKFAGFDTGQKVLEWVKKDTGPKLIGAIVQDSFTMGYKTVEYAINLYEGKPVDEELLIDGIWFNSENVDELIEEGIVY